MKARLQFHFKKMISDPVLVIAWILAILSAFVIHPDSEYPGYIDFRSLGILWGLMVVIQGLRENSVFEKIGENLLNRVKNGWQLSLVLILTCFFTSMLITNDVALITFVPFAIMTLYKCSRKDLMIPVIVLQTIAANLGSMLTPIGNPQNLYLYGVTGISLGDFILTMLPYSAATLLLLIFSTAFLPKKKMPLSVSASDNDQVVKSFGSPLQIAIYVVLFVLAILTVVRIVPFPAMVLTIFVTVLVMDNKIIFRADYILLITFVGFFIFTGNMARITQIKEFLSSIVEGKEFWAGLITSQFISNVPATLVLSDFATDYKQLLLGVNVGGLGTLIASMASLISFKLFSNEYKERRMQYIVAFTAVNLLYLIALIILRLFL